LSAQTATITGPTKSPIAQPEKKRNIKIRKPEIKKKKINLS